MAEFYTSEVTGYTNASGSWVSLSDKYPDRLRIEYSTSITDDGRIAVKWSIEGNASEGKKSDETYTKIYGCSLTIGGSSVCSKTWSSGNLYHGKVIDSGTKYFDASYSGKSITLVAKATIYGQAADNSTGSKTITLPSVGTVRIFSGGEWKQAIPYIYSGGEWKQAIPYVYSSNTWKISG